MNARRGGRPYSERCQHGFHSYNEAQHASAHAPENEQFLYLYNLEDGAARRRAYNRFPYEEFESSVSGRPANSAGVPSQYMCNTDKDNRYPHDNVERPGYWRNLQGNVRDPRQSRYHGDIVEDTFNSRYHNESPSKPNKHGIGRGGHSRFHGDIVEDRGYGKYHGHDFERQKLWRQQTDQLPLQEPNFPSERIENARPIPSILGQDFNRTSSKNWNKSQGNHPATVNVGFSPRGKKVNNPKSCTSQTSLSTCKGNISPATGSKNSSPSKTGTTVSQLSGFQIQENKLRRSDLSLLQQPEGSQTNIPRTSLDKLLGTKYEENQTVEAGLGLLLSSPETSQTGQSGVKLSRGLLPSSSPSSSASPQRTSGSPKVLSSVSGEISQIKTISASKLPVKERKSDDKTDSVFKKFEEKDDRPKVLIEVELVKKIEEIEISTKNKGREENKNLTTKDTFEPHGSKNENKCEQDTENDEKNKNNDIVISVTIDDDSRKLKIGEDVSVDERSESAVGEALRSSSEEINYKSKTDINYTKQNHETEVELSDATEEVLLKIETKDKCKASTFVEQDINEEKSISIENIITDSVCKTKSESENETKIILTLKETDSNNSADNRDLKSIEEGESESAVKPDEIDKSVSGIPDAGNESRGVKREGKKKGGKSSTVNDLHKRVLAKLKKKTSLVKMMNDQSLQLLERSLNSSSNESFSTLETDDSFMEVDGSFNTYSDTSSFDLKVDNYSESENTLNATKEYAGETEIDSINLGQSFTGTTGRDIDDRHLDTSERPEGTEECAAVDENTDMMSEYTDCSTNIHGEATGKGFGDVGCTDKSMHFSDTVELGCKDAQNRVHVFELKIRNSLDIGDAKLDNIDFLGICDVGESGEKSTNKMVDVVSFENNKTDGDGKLENMDTNDKADANVEHMEMDNEVNVDTDIDLGNRYSSNVADNETLGNNMLYEEGKFRSNKIDNEVGIVKFGCKAICNTDTAVALKSKDTSNMVGDEIWESQDPYNTVDEDDDGATQGEPAEAFENETVTAREGIEDSVDSKLRKKFHIKDVFVSLGKIDNKISEVDDIPSKIDEQQGETDDQENEIDDKPSEVGDPVREVDNQQAGIGDERSKLEDQKRETEGKEEETVDVDKRKRHISDKPSDKKYKETSDIAADILQSPMKGKTEGIRCQEKLDSTPNGGQRQVVPLSERFSQLASRQEETETEKCADETIYKAEFENIVNKLNKKKGLSHESGSKTEHEDMDIDEAKTDNIPADSEKAREKDMEKNCGGKNILGMAKDEKEVGNTASPVQNGNGGSLRNVREKTELLDVKKDARPNGTSPVSFLDYSDESDDELLVTPSAFLRSIEEINGRPFVITPTKVMDVSQNSTATTSSSDLSPLKPVPQRPGLKNKFTLDGLLADHEEKADLVREMDEIDQELQDEIRQGGFVNILNKEDAATAESQITEEQREMLKQFEVEESRICEDRPGVLVFEPQHYQCLFTSMLRPTDCGFTVGSNGLSLEKQLESLTPAQYERVITSDIISQCFTKISCQTPLMRWLFFIMSVHDDYQIQQGCKKILLEILHFQHIYAPQKWAPRLVDVLSVLVNYGASLESLIPCGSSTLEIIRGKLIHEPAHIHQPLPQNAGMNTENLILVLQILAQCLHGPSGRYSPNDLSLLCVALCKASLDTSLKNLCGNGAFRNCITMVIRQYLEADWLKERLKLTRMLVSITDHHHNSAHIAELFPPGVRGMFLQRRFCYLVLSEILLDKTNVSDDVLNSIQIKDLEKFVPKIRELLESDSYKLSSVVTLIELCVGVHISLNSEQREQLKRLLEQVRRVRVRDNVSMLDRTRVKDMIVRMTSKWALDIQNMKGKQTKIFEYASPVRMYIEPVHTLQSSGEEDEDHSDIDNDLPCKIQKLSPD